MLHEYGIQNEASDIRAHVSVVNETIYVFQTHSARAALVAFPACPLRCASQPGCTGPTAEGWIMPLDRIADVRRLRVRWTRWAEFSPMMATNDKGALAVAFVVRALELGRFPLWVVAGESADKRIQIAGTDIVVTANQLIQVKCDWRSGDRPKGTGNVFLQKSERNPLRLY
jgi:hypothetical protein